MAKNPRTSQDDRAPSEADTPPVARKMSPAKLEKTRRATELRIDAFMKKVGFANPAERTDDQGWRWFEFGSARGRVGIVASESDGEMFLRAESLVMELPSDQEALFSLMRELLEANMTIAGPARLAINGDGVFVCATVPVVELGAGDVPAHIHSVMAIADSFGNLATEQIKQESANQAAAPAESLANPES